MLKLLYLFHKLSLRVLLHLQGLALWFHLLLSSHAVIVLIDVVLGLLRQAIDQIIQGLLGMHVHGRPCVRAPDEPGLSIANLARSLPDLLSLEACLLLLMIGVAHLVVVILFAVHSWATSLRGQRCGGLLVGYILGPRHSD